MIQPTAPPSPTSTGVDQAAALVLQSTLNLVTDTITSGLGFEVAVMNLIDGDELVVAAVSGPSAVREALLGMRQPRSDWQRLLDASEAWGDLRFLDHRMVDQLEPAAQRMWTPDIPVSEDPDAWHPEDALFAPLTGVDGEVIGTLSVDLPTSGRRPGPVERRALEAFGVLAALALQHAALARQHAVLARSAQVEHLRFQAIFQASPIAVALLGPDGRFCQVNPACCRFLGRADADLLGRDPHEFTHPEDIDSSRNHSRQTRRAAQALESSGLGAGLPAAPALEKRYLLPDGTVVWGLLHLAMLNPLAEPGVVVAQIEDITARKRAEQRLRQQAEGDALTGLPNRPETLRRLRSALRQDAALGLMTAVFFCDLDQFKEVNDAYGHAAGDAYLQVVASRLASPLRRQDTAGRLGGDEFLVVLPGLRAPADAVALARRLIDAVGQPWTYEGRVFRPSISLGIAHTTGGRSIADELVSQADSAMYVAKTRQRGTWQVHEPAASPALAVPVDHDRARPVG